MVSGEQRHPGTTHLLQFFHSSHLPERLRGVSTLFADVAALLVEQYPDGPELTVALRHLLEAKDSAVRHALISEPQ